MPDYTRFKKTFCDCCDTKKLCCMNFPNSRPVRDNVAFIDWEAVLEERDSDIHDEKHCDCIYVNSDKDTTFFIEQKQYLCIYENPLASVNERKLKDPAKFAQKLLKKFQNTKKVFIDDGNKIAIFEFIFAYNLNELNGKCASAENTERLLRINYAEHFGAVGINWMDCKSAAKHILYD